MRLKIALLLLSIFVVSASGQSDSRIPKSALGRTPLVTQPLRITITQFSPSLIDLIGTTPEGGKGQIELQIENTSSEFATFDPHRFSFVNKDGKQVDILDKRHRYNEYLPAVDIRVAPGARVKEFYRLNGKVRLPARLFYDDKMIAEIID